MSYAQKNYDQQLGMSQFTIAEAGALVTAISNLLEKFGTVVTPVEVSSRLSEQNIDAFKLTSFSEVSILNRSISIVSTGNGAPTSDNSIVQFRYTSKITGEEAVTYATVASAADETIIDSYDGEEKHWDIYGGPIGYVTFAQTTVESPTPLIALIEPEKYELHVALPGYADIQDAVNKGKQSVNFDAGTYHKFESASSFVRIGPDPDQTYWINGADNVSPVATPVDNEVDNGSDNEEVKIQVKIRPPDPDKWKNSYTAFLSEMDYLCIKTTPIVDQDGRFGNRELEEGVVHPFAGYFTNKEGKKFYRTKNSVAQGNWYGAPENTVRRVLTDAEADAMINNAHQELQSQKTGLSLHPNRAKLIERVATAEGKFFARFRKK